MADIANLGFSVDTNPLADATKKLNEMAPAASKAEGAADKLGSSLDKVGSSSKKVTAAVTGQIASTEKVAAALGASGVSAERSAVANEANAAAVKVNAVATADLTAMTLRLTTIQNELAFAQRMIAAGNVQNAATSQSLAAIQTELALVTGRLAVAEQALAAAQAEQLVTAQALAVVQGELAVANAAVGASAGAATAGVDALAAGETAAAVAGAGMSTAAIAGLVVLGAIVAVIAAAILGMAAVFASGFVVIGKAVGDLTTGLGLSQKELDKLEKKGVSTTATIGDMFNGLKTTIYDTFKPQIDAITKLFQEWSYKIAMYVLNAAKNMTATFVGAYKAIRDTWALLPAAIGDLTVSAANGVITSIETMINKVIDKINGLLKFANSASSAVGLGNVFGQIENVQLGRISNANEGAAKKVVDVAKASYKAGYEETTKALDKFGNDLINNTRKAGQKRIKDALGDAASGKTKSPGSEGKTDAAKFGDLVTGAENDIATQKARADAVQLSATAAATLEQKTKLLNEAQTKGITLTDAMRTKIDALATAYGAAKVAADEAIAFKAILKGADGDLAGLQAQAELIGLTGRQLAYQTEMQKLLNEAKAKGVTVDAAMRAQLEGKANAFADQSQGNANSSFMDSVSKGAAERKIQLEQERAEIGLNADQVNRLRIENDLLAQARQKNIDLTPADLAAIGQVASEQAAAEAAIRKTRDALDFARDTAKGFFNDLSNGIRQGNGLWESFASAALNALNKIINKLLDKAITSLINTLIPGGGGGGFFSALFSAKGNAFDDGVSAFAKGGSFANQIVNSPTAFAFGKGGSNLGIMGEAGPEAVIPLKRGNDGSLGVQMHGGNQGGMVINAPITFQNDNRVTGAVSSDDIVALQRRSAEQNKADIRREIPNIIRQYQQDGALV